MAPKLPPGLRTCLPHRQFEVLSAIATDFCFRRRERVIEYVSGKHGRPNVAQIITFGTARRRTYSVLSLAACGSWL